MPNHQFRVFELGFNTVRTVSADAKIMTVQDNDLIFDDEAPYYGETYDGSQQNLASAIGVGAVGQAVEAVYKWDVFNQSTGQAGTAYLIRVYSASHEAGRGHQNGEYYQAFSMEVNKGDHLAYGAANYVGQVPYASLFGAAPINAAPVFVNHALTPAFGAGDPVVKLGADDLKATDADHGQTLTYTVDSLPKGVLLVHGEIAAVGASFTQADVDAGHVQLLAGPLGTDVVTPNGAISGAGIGFSDTFGVTVRDGAGGSVSGTFDAGHATFDTVQTQAQWGGYWGGNGNDYQRGTSGSDNMSGGNGHDLMIGGEGNDNISGNEGNNRLFGQDGDDTVNGGNGDDLLDGGAGNDQIHANGGNNWLFGGAGSDTITADWGNDRAWGGDGDDQISVNAGNNRVDGGAGNDLINVGGGNDTVIGGAGDDRISDNGGSNKFQLGGIANVLSDGNDDYTTGHGADKFVLFLNDREGHEAGWGSDTINGFRIGQGDQLVAFNSKAGFWDDRTELASLAASDFVTAARGVGGNAGDLTLTFGAGSAAASSVTLKWFFWDNGSFGTTIGSSTVTDGQLVDILSAAVQDGASVGVTGTDFLTKMHDYVTDDFLL